jgi:predicted PurR-regulated permease PerM
MKESLKPITKYWPIIIVAALVGALIFVAPFISIIALAALMAYLFNPLYKKIQSKVKNDASAAGLTLLVSTIFIITPIAVVLFVTVLQLFSLWADVAAQYAGVDFSSLPDFVKNIVANANATLAPISGQAAIIPIDGVIDFFRNTLPAVIKSTAVIAIGFAGSIPIATILAIMYIILFCDFLIYGKKLIGMATHLSPFDIKTTKSYFDRIGTMAKAMVKGQFLISVIISALSAFLLVFLGMGQYFFLIFVVFTLLNLIPLGCGVLMIPITIIAMLTGNFWPGLIVLILYILISNLDSFIRPRIIPKSVTLSAGLTALSAFGGIYYYGLLGVVYGPIVMIVIVTTVTMYVEQRKALTAKATS